MLLGGHQGIHNVCSQGLAVVYNKSCTDCTIMCTAYSTLHKLALKFYLFDGVGRSCLGRL